MAEQNIPNLEDYRKKYENTAAGEAKALNDYVAALELFIQSIPPMPVREDFKNKTEFLNADRAWRKAYVDRSMTGKFSDYNSVINLYNKIIEDRKIPDIEQELNAPTPEEQAEIDKQESETRESALKNVAIPTSKGLLTRDEWLEEWAILSPTLKEQFKSRLAEALGSSPQNAAIRSLDVNDPMLQDSWLQYGLYLSELYREDEKSSEKAWSPNSFARYVEESGLFDIAEGDRTAVEQDIINFYRNNGLPVLQSFVNDVVNKVSKGDLDLETWKQAQRKLLSKEYPDFADEFAAGFDLKDLASNYISKMAEVLELDANTIDLNNSLIKNGLQARTPDGKLTTKTLREFELDLRQDPRWKQTQRAQQEASSAATFILEKFGFRS